MKSTISFLSSIYLTAGCISSNKNSKKCLSVLRSLENTLGCFRGLSNNGLAGWPPNKFLQSWFKSEQSTRTTRGTSSSAYLWNNAFVLIDLANLSHLDHNFPLLGSSGLPLSITRTSNRSFSAVLVIMVFNSSNVACSVISNLDFLGGLAGFFLLGFFSSS